MASVLAGRRVTPYVEGLLSLASAEGARAPDLLEYICDLASDEVVMAPDLARRVVRVAIDLAMETHGGLTSFFLPTRYGPIFREEVESLVAATHGYHVAFHYAAEIAISDLGPIDAFELLAQAHEWLRSDDWRLVAAGLTAVMDLSFHAAVGLSYVSVRRANADIPSHPLWNSVVGRTVELIDDGRDQVATPAAWALAWIENLRRRGPSGGGPVVVQPHSDTELAHLYASLYRLWQRSSHSWTRTVAAWAIWSLPLPAASVELPLVDVSVLHGQFSESVSVRRSDAVLAACSLLIAMGEDVSEEMYRVASTEARSELGETVVAEIGERLGFSDDQVEDEVGLS